MSFFFGQRVKKVRGVANLGVTGTVVEPNNGRRDGLTLTLVPDSGWLNVFDEVRPAGIRSHWDPVYWEPILPDGLESNEEIAALYEPSPNVKLADISERREWKS